MPDASTTNGRARRGPDRRLLAASVLLAAAAGAWVGQRLREPVNAATSEPPKLIDWRQARDIAVSINRDEALPMAERRKLDAEYRALVARCLPLVSQYTTDHLPDAPERTFAFDRVDWVNANIDAFERLFAPLEGIHLLGEAANRTLAAQLFGTLNQKILSAEVGLLLGYLARRVLGQYDLALLGREPVSAGKLYYVEPNIRLVERTLRLPAEEFRTWLALHETTHAFEFEAHPWLRSYFNGLLEEYFEFLKEDVDRLKQGVRGLRVFVERARARDGESESWLEAIMTPDQRALFQRMQATMCMVEGYSNHVMNAVGRQLLPSYDVIARRFEQRQRQRSFAEQLFARLTGLDVKLEQYRLGQAFIDDIAARRGHETVKRIWDGPESLPTMQEIRHPDAWLARVVDRA
jgi:coenzyme F420 biosynthesis associated uncharacterized protein